MLSLILRKVSLYLRAAISETTFSKLFSDILPLCIYNDNFDIFVYYLTLLNNCSIPVISTD